MSSIRALYRVQLTAEFDLAALGRVVPYLHRLGISHLYLSPVFRSRAGSQHGYDVTDHAVINPELGGEAGLAGLVEVCSAHDMGLVLDIVPNHMAVMSADNAWWMDVLEHGAASQHAEAFDIDWFPARASMRHRLLVPALAEPLGEALAKGDIQVQFAPEQGRFWIGYQSLRFPVDPQAYPAVLGLAREHADLRSGTDAAALVELASLLDAFASLPGAEPSPQGVRVLRAQQCAELKQRLALLCEQQPALARAIQSGLEQVGRPDSGNDKALLALLGRQPYRLAYWKVSGEEINYRRFFDVNELAALRIEESRVFASAHALIRELWTAGSIDGLRVDHADGLYDPRQYFDRLRALLHEARGDRRSWVVAEKILGSGEKLPADWKVEGTTGYEFAALVTGWLMHPGGAASLDKLYARQVNSRPYAETAYVSRRQVMRTSLAAEISGLAARLDRLAQLHPTTLDFTLFDLREAIVEVIAHFPVYRTYVRDGAASAEDQQNIRRAVGAARGRKQASARALQFLEGTLLGEGGGELRVQEAARTFAMKFQQVSAPVMAKGIEDTAYYRHSALLAMNEVGGDPTCRAVPSEAVHRANDRRQKEFPLSVLATSTHDTKRGEDARYRLCALSEHVSAWTTSLSHWRRLKGRGREARQLSADLQYLLLQTLLAIWPAAGSEDTDALRDRLCAYALKAAREAKEQTSWLEPDEDFEAALKHYIGLMLPADSANGFARYFGPLLPRLDYFGALNALSATVLKLTAPGVPDTYQGTERPTLVLVDPDNRHTPDYAAHADALAALEAQRGTPDALATALLDRCVDGRLKHYVTWQLLQLRSRHPALQEQGVYVPLTVEGELAEQVCAFARVHENHCVIAVATRWAATLSPDALKAPVGERWGDTRIVLPEQIPPGHYVDALTGQSAAAHAGSAIPLARLLSVLPVSVLATPGSLH